MTPGDLLRFPQALSIRDRPDDPPAKTSALAARVEDVRGRGAGELETMRVREGGYLRTDLDAPPGGDRRTVRARGDCRRAGVAGLQARLQERVRELRADAMADEGAIAQEIAKFVGRSTSPKKWSGSADISSTGAPCRTVRNRAAGSSISCCRR